MSLDFFFENIILGGAYLLQHNTERWRYSAGSWILHATARSVPLLMSSRGLCVAMVLFLGALSGRPFPELKNGNAGFYQPTGESAQSLEQCHATRVSHNRLCSSIRLVTLSFLHLLSRCNSEYFPRMRVSFVCRAIASVPSPNPEHRPASCDQRCNRDFFVVLSAQI